MKNRNCKMVVSKKEYKCECCNRKINIGDKYLRLNINRNGIFHFCKKCKNTNMDEIKQIIEKGYMKYEENHSIYVLNNPIFYDDEGNYIAEDFGLNDF